MRGAVAGYRPLARAAVLAVSLLALVAHSAEAQLVRGSVRDADTDEVVPGASVRLLDPDSVLQRSAITDVEGAFELRAPTPGEFRLGVEVLGYAPTNTNSFILAAGDSLGLEIHIKYAPIALDPLDVTIYSENRMGFERRRELSYGTRIGPEELANIGDRTLNEFSSQVAPWLNYRNGFEGLYTYPVNSKGRRCFPTLVVDGERFDTPPGFAPDLDRWFDPEDIAAIEVYRDPSLLPEPYWSALRAKGFGASNCVVAIWTHAGFGTGEVQ